MARLIGVAHGEFVRFSNDDYPSSKMVVSEVGITPTPGDYFSVDLSPDYARQKIAALGLTLGPRDNSNTRKGFCRVAK
jgi:hypothetical protein